MRIAIGGIVQETDTFPRPLTRMEAFTIVRDQELLAASAPPGIAGFLSALEGVTPVPLLFAGASRGGPVMRETFHVLVSEMVHRLAARLPVDGVLLVLHGGMAVEDEPDAALEIIERTRNVVPAGTPIGVALDRPIRVGGDLILHAGPDVFDAARATASGMLRRLGRHRFGGPIDARDERA
jgi:microcystin degradation protein MlrC